MNPAVCYPGLEPLGEDQPFGEVRWFNDAVLVHRTPPYAVNTLYESAGFDDRYTLDELNETFSVGPNEFNLPQKLLSLEQRNKQRYDLDGEPPRASRALLRITVREWRKHKR